MPVTTIAPSSGSGAAFGLPGAADGCGALGSPGGGAVSVVTGGTVWAAGSVDWARAADGSAKANNDEQQPPASSKARRERSEWTNAISPLFGQSCTEHSRPRLHTHYGSASILVRQS